MSPIKDFSVTYKALNKECVFSEGDTVAGAVSFTLTKDTKVKSVLVKVKGEAHVHWKTGTGDHERSHTASRRFFKEKQYLVPVNDKGTELPKGVHRFKFKLQIPQGDFPSSFRGFHGRIVYAVQAKLCRSWRMDSSDTKEIKFLSKSIAQHRQLMGPDKNAGSVSKGEVHLSATLDKNVCSPGDTLSVVAKIRNSSSKTTRGKFSIVQKVVYSTVSSSTCSYQSIVKVVGNPVETNSGETASCHLTVPHDTIFSIHNCDILTVEYYVKVYLDIRFAIDPEVLFPLIIIPRGFTGHHPGAAGPNPAGAPSNSDFPPPAFPAGPYPGPAGPYPGPTGPYPGPAGPYPSPAGPYPAPVGPYPGPAGPAAYGYPAPAPAPAQNPTMVSGYNNPWPQQPAPHGFPPGAFSSPSVQHQPPSAPPQQEEQPPAYTSIYPNIS